MLWIFDSWFWWLQTLKYFKNFLPNENFIFLADSKNVPYWEKTENEIKKYTKKWIKRLFDKWCDNVIIACNTAVAWLYKNRDLWNKKWKIFGVTFAWLQEIIKWPYRKIWILATETTKKLNVYPTIYYDKLRWEAEMFIQDANELVYMIENAEKNEKKISKTIKKYVDMLPNDIDCIVLWCTHFPVYINFFWELFPQCKIIDPWRASVVALSKHLEKKNIWQKRNINIYCTWNIEKFKIWANLLRNEKLNIKQIKID